MPQANASPNGTPASIRQIETALDVKAKVQDLQKTTTLKELAGAVAKQLGVRGPIATSSSPANRDKADDASADIDLAEVWKRVLEVNEAWLDPRPSCLHYTLTASSKDPEIRIECVNRVWLDGKRWRWEMESESAFGQEEPVETLNYTLVSDGDEEVYRPIQDGRGRVRNGWLC